MIRGARAVVLVLGGVVVLGVSTARAQDAAGLMAADEAMVQQLLRPRSVDELTAEYETAKRRAEAADKELEDSSGVVSIARARVDVKKGEIALLKTRSKLAKKEGHADQRAEIQRLLAREESGLRVFQAMRAAAEAQKDRAEAASGFARARMTMQDAELDLARMHEARVANRTATPAAVAELDARIRKSARSVLESMRAYANASDRLADSTGDLARARLDLLDAWEGYQGL